jgi:hypothetical protein
LDKLYLVDAEHCIAACGNVYVSIWRKNPTAERLKRLQLFAQQFLRETTGPTFAIVLVEEHCQTPDDEGRKHSVAFIEDLRGRAVGIALVFEGSGFLAAASRAVMVGLMTAARFPIPYKVVSRVSEAEAYIRKQTPDLVPPKTSLLAAIERCRSTMATVPSDSGRPRG